MKIVKILFAVLLLAVIGLVVMYFVTGKVPFLDQDVADAILGPTYPKEAAELRQPVNLSTDKRGFVNIQGVNREDVYFMQGYHHGKQHGKELDQVRRLFQGDRVEQIHPDIASLSELFYYLDLPSLSQDCAERYPQQVLAMIRAYAAGLDAGNGTQRPWSVDDVFLLQRGYAFLMGHNFVKEWAIQRLLQHFAATDFAEISTYYVKDFGALSQNLSLSPGLNALLAKPIIEPVRLHSDEGVLGGQTRTHPYFAWVIEPTVIQIDEVYSAEGFALVGQPFLFAARTGTLTFFRQPILSNDDQFAAVPEGSFSDPRDPRVFLNNEASALGQYPEPPKHTPLGRKVNAMVGGLGGKDLYYQWDGFRPSADLAASYYLLEAGSIDAAINAYAYQQVPASELTLVTARGHVVNLSAHPTDPRDENPSQLFSKPYTRIGRPISHVTGLHFRGEASWEPGQSQQVANSALDDRLAAMLRFYLRGPISETMMSLDKQETILALLAEQGNARKDFFIQQLWFQFGNLLQEEYFAETARPAVKGLSFEIKSMILSVYARSTQADRTDRRMMIGKIRSMTGIIDKAWSTLKQYDQHGLSYTLPTRKGPRDKTYEFFVRSEDSPTGLFFVDEGRRIVQVATHTFAWGEDFQYWQYGFTTDGTMDNPKRVGDLSVGEDSYLVRPKL